MTDPYPSQPRRLMRDPSNKLIGGVCSGLAKYLNMDVNLVRILVVIISLFTGVPIVLYLLALFLLPEERDTPPPPPHVNAPPSGYGSGYGGPTYQPMQGHGPSQPVDDVWGPGGAPWEQPPTPAPAAGASSATAPPTWPQAPAANAAQQSPEPESASTSYDTAPATAEPASPSAWEPASAAEPEPLPETEVPQVSDSDTSSWESAPAHPQTEDPRKDG